MIRLAPVYGLRERPDFAVHSMAQLVSSEDGTGAVDFSALSEMRPQAPCLFVDDAVPRIASSVDALDAARHDGATATCEASEISSSRDVGAEEIVRGLRETLGQAASRDDGPGSGTGIQITDNAARAVSIPADSSNVTLGVGLSRFMRWFRAANSEFDRSKLTSAGVS